LWEYWAVPRSRIPGFKSPRRIVDDCREDLGFTKEKIYGGGNRIALRYLEDIMVSDGLALVGDVAHTTCPANGSGTVPSMISGTLMANNTARVLKQGQTPSRESLWSYTHEMHVGLGAVFAGYYISQRILGQFNEDEIQEFIRHGMIGASDFIAVHETLPPKINTREGISRFVKAMPVFSLFSAFVRHAPKIGLIMRHYKKYPEAYDPEALYEWKDKRDAIIDSITDC